MGLYGNGIIISTFIVGRWCCLQKGLSLSYALFISFSPQSDDRLSYQKARFDMKSVQRMQTEGEAGYLPLFTVEILAGKGVAVGPHQRSVRGGGYRHLILAGGRLTINGRHFVLIV